MSWEWETPEGDLAERHHRLAVIHGACPECAPNGLQSWLDMMAEWSEPEPAESPDPGTWLTPEGEVASFTWGLFRVDDPVAFERWAGQALQPVGGAFAEVVDVDGVPWTRALLWLDDDDYLRVHAASIYRFHHLLVVLKFVWPPVWECMRMVGGSLPTQACDYPQPMPPAEASVLTRLRRVPVP